jgi:beta-lactamase regulating signal transducer with metallopeptidase domain
MTWIAGWSDMPAVTAAGWSLVHFLWQGALIALVPAVLLPLCRSAGVRYGVSSAAMLAMLAAFGLTLVVSVPEQQSPPVSVWSYSDAGRDPVSGSSAAPLLPWVVLFWMAGALLAGLYRVGGWMAARRLRRAGVCAAPVPWQERLEQLARRMSLVKPLSLLESSLAEVPVVIGFLRPAILVPAGLLAGVPAAQMEAILLHELAHIRTWIR